MKQFQHDLKLAAPFRFEVRWVIRWRKLAALRSHNEALAAWNLLDEPMLR